MFNKISFLYNFFCFKSKLDSIEKYDVQHNRWEYFTTLRDSSKQNMATAVYENRLYMVGGYKSETDSNPVCPDVEYFDLEKLQYVQKK